MVRRLSLSLLLLTVICSGSALSQEKKELDHDAYDIWNRITEKSISGNGSWVHYVLGPEDRDGTLVILNPSDNRRYEIPRGSKAEFMPGSNAIIFRISPPIDSLRAAKRKKKDEKDLPGDTLGVINLQNGDFFTSTNLESFKIPEESGTWMAYHLKEDDRDAPPDSTEESSTDSTSTETEDDKKEGTTLVIRDTQTGSEIKFEYVREYVVSATSDLVVFAVSVNSMPGDGMYALHTTTGQVDTLLSGAGNYKKIAIDQSSRRVAFLSDSHSYESDDPMYRAYVFDTASQQLAAIDTPAIERIPDGWTVSEHGDVHFSDSGERLFFGTAPTPEPEPEDELLDEEKVVVDVWSWTDADFYPAQKKNSEEEKKRSYAAVYLIDKDKAIQLADESVPTLTLIDKGDGSFALANTNEPYRMERSWDYPPYYDTYAVEIESGARRELLTGVQSRPSLSPDGRFIAWWDRDELAWVAMPTGDDAPVTNMTAAIQHPVHNEIHDWPYPANPYGSAGWTEDGSRFLVYDKHDIWSVDPSARKGPRSLTDGKGRTENLRFRYVELDDDQTGVPADEDLLLSSFDYSTKGSGFYGTSLNSGSLQKLMMDDYRFSTPEKAEQSETVLFTRESFVEFPDLWVSSLDLSNPEKITRANPQQGDYMWGTVELVEWTSLDGIPVEGLLYKPDDFDPTQKYPLMVYFYEKNANNLHSHMAPAPHRSVINRTFYVSRGYLVFVPDIPYKIGYPGESAMNAVMPGVTSLVSTGFVDEENIGVQGHSWGGYQIAYMVTRTNLFKAAEAGAPVSNMISAYGGVRWGSGLSRMFQYERTQSRIGGSLWEYPLRYISNSPIFAADKIETPLLIMHNDEDGAVPWYQGIELFAALRRLDKPVWLINYNGEPHWPTTFPNKRDWAVRMQQFFDHYLKDAPAPEWIVSGVPAVRKGSTLGLESSVPASQ